MERRNIQRLAVSGSTDSLLLETEGIGGRDIAQGPVLQEGGVASGLTQAKRGATCRSLHPSESGAVERDSTRGVNSARKGSRANHNLGCTVKTMLERTQRKPVSDV
jgi:hypothetical protein